jgi:hypothetical protein
MLPCWFRGHNDFKAKESCFRHNRIVLYVGKGSHIHYCDRRIVGHTYWNIILTLTVLSSIFISRSYNSFLDFTTKFSFSASRNLCPSFYFAKSSCLVSCASSSSLILVFCFYGCPGFANCTFVRFFFVLYDFLYPLLN